MASDANNRGYAFPFRSVTAAVLFTALLCAGVWRVWEAYLGHKEQVRREFRLHELCGILLQADEQLTMVTRMCVTTGDLKWEERHQQFNPGLDSSFEEFLKLSSYVSASKAAAQTSAAGDEIALMERKAFDMVGHGDGKAGEAILASEEYERYKRIYADGIDRVKEAIHAGAESGFEHERSRLVFSAAAVAVALLILCFTWFAAFKVVRGYIAARKQAEVALKSSELEYRKLFETANDAILIFEPENEFILEANKKACDVYGFSRDELVGMSLERLTRDVPRGKQRIAQLLRERSLMNVETVHIKKDGTAVDMLMSSSVIEYGGKTAVLSINRDVTEIRLLQQQLIQTEKLAALGQLVSGVAHEINNPLTPIIGHTQLLLRSPLDGRIRQRLEIINREAMRTRRIVQNLLSFSRQHTPARTGVDINEVLDRTLELRAYDMKMNNVDLRRERKSVPNVLGDEYQLQQVFLNIIINSEQAMHGAGQGGTLSIRTDVADRGSGRDVVVTISDDGPGVAQQNQSKIFDPFFTTKPVGEGTGLGLSISYGIIKEHDGSIRVESIPGTGASFIIELPAYNGADSVSTEWPLGDS